MGLGAKQFPTYIHTLGQLGFLMRPLRHPPCTRVSVRRRKGEGGGIRCINMNGRTSNDTTIIMATYPSTSGSAAAATVSAGCAGDDHKREKDRFVYCTLSL